MDLKNAKITKLGWGFGGCNMNCRHCYNASGKKFPAHDFKKLCLIAGAICAEGVKDINFGTGEFIINPNALAVARYIKDKYPAVKLGLTSNGYSVIKMKDQELKRLFHDIDISIDFPASKKHNAFRCHDKAWEWAMSALKRCRRLDIEHSIVSCVTSQTRDSDIKGLLELARKHESSLRLNWFRPTGRGKRDMCINVHRFWQIIYYLSKNAVFEGLSDPLLRAVIEEKENFTPCGCGWTSARIQQDLSVTPCVFLKGDKWNSGKITENKLSVLSNHKNFKSLRSFHPKKCLNCPYVRACRGGCYSRAVLQAGSGNKPDAFCPMNSEQTKILLPKIRKNIKISNSNKVHNGYLCTLIVKAK